MANLKLFYAAYPSSGVVTLGHGYMRLSAVTLPSDALSTTENFPTNVKAEGSSTAWASLPEVPMTTSFDVTNSENVLLIADISCVQHATIDTNTFFQVIVDDTTVVALSNTGNAEGYLYRSLSFQGVAGGLSTGLHTAELKV